MHEREIPGLAITEFLPIFHFRQHCFPSGLDCRGMPPVAERNTWPCCCPLANPYRSVVNSAVERKRRQRGGEEKRKIADNGLHGYQDEQMATRPLGNLRFRPIVLCLYLRYPNAIFGSPCPFPNRAPTSLVHEFFPVSSLPSRSCSQLARNALSRNTRIPSQHGARHA